MTGVSLTTSPSHMTTLEEARTNLRVALAAKQSDREKRIVRLD